MEKFVKALKAFLSHLPKQTQKLIILNKSDESAITFRGDNPAAASASSELVVASESFEPAVTFQLTAAPHGSDAPGTHCAQFDRQNKKVQALFTSIQQWTEEPLSFFHGNTLNLNKDVLDSIDKYVGGLFQRTSDFDSVRVRILQMTYYRVKDEILAKQRLRGDGAKEDLINTLQQGGLNTGTPNHDPLQWVGRGHRLAEICKDIGYKTGFDYCFTANLFLLDDITDTE